MHTVVCTFQFWERVWNISAQIRECCGDHCCVFQNHDYFLSCLRRKSRLTPSSFSLSELLCVCRCIHVYVSAPVCMACMHICVASQRIKRNTPCVAFSSLYRASPLSHVITENPTASHTSDKTQSPVWIVQRLRNSAEDGKCTHASEPALTPNTRPTGLFSLENMPFTLFNIIHFTLFRRMSI